MAREFESLGDILVAEGVLSREELEEVVAKSQIRNLPLEETLFKLGYITRDQLSSLLARAYKCDFIALPSLRVSEDALRALSAEKALTLHALPYALEGDTLCVALGASFASKSFSEVVADIERSSGKKVRASLCNPEPLKEMLIKYYKELKSPRSVPLDQDEFSFIIKSIRSEDLGSNARTQFEELNDIGQTALIAARSHPFSRAVANAIEEARVKLADAKKYSESGFDEEAVEMARQAISMLNEASAKADVVEKSWESLIHQVKDLRARINGFEEDGAAEYAPADFKRLAEIREELLHCVNDRNVDRLRFLLEQGAVVTEKVRLMAPDRNRGREQVIASLAKVREVIARARKAGAKEYAQESLKQSYEFLDSAETHARHAQWDEVRECLASAESKAIEAERIALGAEDEKKRLAVKLREKVRSANAALEEALERRYAYEVMDDLMQVKDAINQAKACFDTFDTSEIEKGIGIAESAATLVRKEILPRVDEAEHAWKNLLQRADTVSSRMRSIDISPVLRIAADKAETFFECARIMTASLCERNRAKLADAVSACETITDEIGRFATTAREGLQTVETAVETAGDLLAEAAASVFDENLRSAFGEARALLKDANDSLKRGEIDSSRARAEAARSKLQTEVIEPQQSAHQQWLILAPRVSDLLRKADAALTPDLMYYCPGIARTLRASVPETLEAVAARDLRKIGDCIESVDGTMRNIAVSIETAKEERHRKLSEELAEIEKAVQTAVQRCGGNYSPDMLESAYLDLSRLKQQLAEGPNSLSPSLENTLTRDLAVARTKVWQVEFMRERFEAERRENLNQLRLKMESAREAIDVCARLDYIGDAFPSVSKARSLLEQAENLLIEGDIDESFELVRQCQATAESIYTEAEEREQRWKTLVHAITAADAAHKRVLADPVAARVAAEKCKTLSEMVSRSNSLIESKNVDALAEYAENLERLACAAAEEVNTWRSKSLNRVEERIREAMGEIRLALQMKAEIICPDVINAARAYLDIAQRYGLKDDFDRADSAVKDALTKARDAATLAQAAMERVSALALDYMKIASANIAQQRMEEAKGALDRGVTLAELARVTSHKE